MLPPRSIRGCAKGAPVSADFYAKIRDFTASAKGARKKLVSFLLQHPEEAAFMTIEEIAVSSGVSAGMVSRTVRKMGFDGFADMQNQIRHVVRKNITPAARLQRASQGEATFRDTVRFEMKSLASILKLNSEESVRNAVSLLAKASAVHVIGLRSSYAPAYAMVLGLSQIRRNVFLVDLGAGTLAEQVQRLSSGDLVMIISFPRYLKESLLMAQEAKIAKCPVLAVTDSFASPLAMQADVALLSPYESLSFFNSPIAAMGLVNTLLAETAQALGEKSAAELERIGAIQNRWKLLVSSEDSWRPNLPNN